MFYRQRDAFEVHRGGLAAMYAGLQLPERLAGLAQACSAPGALQEPSPPPFNLEALESKDLNQVVNCIMQLYEQLCNFL